MPSVVFQRVRLQYAGIAQPSDLSAPACVVDMNGSDVVTVTVQATEGTWGTAVLAVRYGPTRYGPWCDYDTPVTFSAPTPPATSQASGLLAVVDRFLAIDITTGEGAADYADITVNHRRSEIGTPITI